MDRDSATKVALAAFVALAMVGSWLAGADVGLRDAGELGAAAAVLGVPHPTGFPLDMLLLHAATYLPLGAVAFRQNVVTAWIAAAALALLVRLALRLAESVGASGARRELLPAALASASLCAVGLGAWETFIVSWSYVEVYALAVLWVALAGNVALDARRRVEVLALCLGLSIGAHIAARLAIAPLLFACVLQRRGELGPRSWILPAAMVAVGAVVVSYLPFASLRNPAVDWGDPETLGRLIDHLTGARIRSAYAEAMLASSDVYLGALAGQLRELLPLLPLAMVGAVALAHTRRGPLSLVLAVFAIDLAYAAYINPMGIKDRQVGQLAGACVALLAGVGGFVVARAALRSRFAHRVVLSVMALLVALLLRSTHVERFEDAYASTEALGSGGLVSSLPPKAVFVCRTDDVCAASLFALHAEGIRPDVRAAPGQHLWDPLAISGLAEVSPSLRALAAQPEPPAEQRSSRAEQVLRALFDGSTGVPIRFESIDGAPRGVSLAADLEGLDRARKARLGEGAPAHPWARGAWGGLYEGVGKAAYAQADPATALRAFTTARFLSPELPSTWTNVGVLLAGLGRLDEAIDAAEEALRLDSTRVVAWRNLVRYLRAAGREDEARAMADRAARTLPGVPRRAFDEL